MDEGEGGYGEGGDRNEAISAVADEGFLGEEDDDYEDLYNDVNVGEGFLQSFHRAEDTGFRNQEEKRIEAAAESTGVSIPGVVGGGGAGEGMVEKGVSVSEPVYVAPATRLDGYQNLGFRGNDLTTKGMDSVLNTSGGGLRVSLGQPQVKMSEAEGQVVHNNSMPPQGLVQQSHGVGAVNIGNENYARQGGGGGGGGGGVGAVNVGNENYARQAVGGVGVGGVGNMNLNGGSVGGGGGGTILFVGDLHWWTTDSELEAELCKYGSVKEVRFYDEKASGKSKGYCQVEFNDSSAATACKDGMNGHLFNGRPCVVAFASPHTVRRMGEAQVNKNQTMTQGGPLAQGRRGVVDAGGGGGGGRGGSSIATGGNYQGDGNRNYGRGSWGRGNAQGMGRGQVGPMRNRIGGMGGRGIIGNGGNGFGQGFVATPPLMHTQTMMGQGFDPSYGAHMGRMGGYGGFPTAPTPPFSGLLSQFPPVGGVGLPGVAPHVNPAFFGRGMPANGMGMMPTAGVEGHGMGMWADPSVAGWVNEEPGGRVGDSSYGDDAASDHQNGEISHERAGWPNSSMKEKERAPEREWSGASDKRYRDEREPAAERDIPREKDVGHDHDWPERRHRDDRETGRERERERDRERDRDRERERDRDRYREDRERYVDHHRYRERDLEHDNEWDRGRPSASHKSRLPHEEGRRSRSRDADYAKRRRLPSE